MTFEYDDIDPPPGRDALYEVAYNESVRGLTQQAGVLDNLRTRAGLLITAANVVTALLAAQAIANRPGIGVGGWAAIGAFVACMALVLYVLLPWGDWNFAFDAQVVVAIIEGKSEPSIARLHRRLAFFNENSQQLNAARLKEMFSAFRWGCIALGVEVALWLVVLAKVNVCGVQL